MGSFRSGIDADTNANVTTLILVTMLIAVTAKSAVPQHLSPLSLLLLFTIHAREKGLEMGCVTGDYGDRSKFSLSAGREDGACDANQTGGDGNSVACNRKPFTFRKFQIGVPYRIEETQPCDHSAGERDPKCLDCSKGRRQSHFQSLPALCVEMVAAKFRRPGRGCGQSLRSNSLLRRSQISMIISNRSASSTPPVVPKSLYRWANHRCPPSPPEYWPRVQRPSWLPSSFGVVQVRLGCVHQRRKHGKSSNFFGRSKEA